MIAYTDGSADFAAAHSHQRTALLIIDLISDFRFEDGEDLLVKAQPIAERIDAIRAQMDARDEPVIYVNDNFGEWHSERTELVDRALSRSNPIAGLIRPRESDLFIIKPQFSGFYATNLPVLLPKLGVTHLILTGVAADICVLFTAADAHMRDYQLWVPQDAVASTHDERKCWALEIMRTSMGAETAASLDLSVASWRDETHDD